MDEPAGATAWNKARIEALSDGIFAIVMTLLVLELKVPDLPPKGGDRRALARGARALADLLQLLHHVRARQPVLVLAPPDLRAHSPRGQAAALDQPAVPDVRSVSALIRTLLVGPVLAIIAIAVQPDMGFNAFLVGQAVALGVARRWVRKAPI